MSELEQGQNSVSCLTELERSGCWEVLMAKVSGVGGAPDAPGACCRVENTARAQGSVWGAQHRDGPQCRAPVLGCRTLGTHILCQ